MKVAYNACYGGFGLSKEAVLLGRKLSNNHSWGGVCLKGDTHKNGNVCDADYGARFDSNERTDEFLIAVIEQLGGDANGRFADLAIAEIPDGADYEITEYDGFEGVEPPRPSW